MKSEVAHRIARFCNDNEISKWRTNVGKFVQDLQSAMSVAVNKACDDCPFRNFVNVGGCIGAECPIHLVRHSLNRANARAVHGVKDIYKEKFKKTA